MSPDSVETRIGVLGEQIRQADKRAEGLEHQLRSLGGIVSKVEVMDERFQASQRSSQEYRAETTQLLHDIQAQQKQDRIHFDKELEERDERLAKNEKDQQTSKRSTWLAVAALMIAFGGMVATVLQALSSVH